jgi:hypothetical protein
MFRQLRPSDVPRLRFRQRQSMLARHLPLALRSNNGLLPIGVGPSRHKAISKVSVGDLLASKGYPEPVYGKVRVSEIPFQAF